MTLSSTGMVASISPTMASGGRARSDSGGLYYARTDGSLIRELVQPMIMPNGVGLSPDEKTVYVAETRTGHLWGFDIVSPGVIRQQPPHENGGHHLAGPAGYTSFEFPGGGSERAISASPRWFSAAST